MDNIDEILSKEELAICKQEQEFFATIGIYKDIKSIALSHNFIQKHSQNSVNLTMLKEYQILLLKEDSEHLIIARKEHLSEKILKDIEQQVHKKIIQKIIPANEFDEKYNKLFKVNTKEIQEQIKAFNDKELENHKVIELYDNLLSEAVFLGVSDIHINEYNDFGWIKYRVDGKIEQKYIISKDLINRISLITKEISNLDIVNTINIQSSSFTKNIFNENVDFRVEIAPSGYGENIVLRILDKNKNFKHIKKIFPKSHPISKHLYPYLNLKDGFFLLVGPTGSGKSTTLSAIVTNRDRLSESIYTVEDPIEYKIDFVTQYQVNDGLNLSFSKILKSIMRQDPDVIVIGEMRDSESINSALRASHSGHMVYSTLHTKSAHLAIQRIKDAGGDLFILANSLSAIIAQRLIPRLCSCKIEDENKNAKEFLETEKSGYKKNGCIKCNFTGVISRELLVDTIFVPSDAKVRKKLYTALIKNDFTDVNKDLFIFSYLDSARYLYENGLCDFETLYYELKSLGL